MIPYDRTLLTKALPVGDAKSWSLRPPEYLKDADIDVFLKSRVYSINKSEKKVILTDGTHVSYDKLCIATGSEVIKPEVQGIGSKNVHFLRTHQDQTDIKQKAANAKSIVVVGASFIGHESAASLAGKYGKEKDIHMICSGDGPLQNILGKEIGQMLLKEHQENNVKVHTNKTLKSIKADQDGNVTSVELSDGSLVEA